MKNFYYYFIMALFFLIHLFWMNSVIRFAAQQQTALCIIFTLLFLFTIFFTIKKVKIHYKYIAVSIFYGFLINYISIIIYYFLLHPNKEKAFKFIEQTFQTVNGFNVNFIITGLVCGSAIIGPIYAEIIYRIYSKKIEADN